jgi:acetyl-CoA C-acetyltransferase
LRSPAIQRAKAATEAGHFKNEIVGIEIETPEGKEVHLVDEGIRFDATMESISSVKLLQEGGSITAATSSQICDGASAALIVSEQALKDHGLTPRARIHHISVTAGDPIIMLEEPLFATEKALKKAGIKIEDIDAYEVNEAFAPVPLAWLKYLGASHDRLNVHGGAIALGHPLGASGTKADGDAARRSGCQGRQIWPADDVRRRWPGQRHNHRTALTVVAPAKAGAAIGLPKTH